MNTQDRHERHLQRLERHKEKIAKMEARLGALPEQLRVEHLRVTDMMKNRLERIENEIQRM
ncbi:hypothetical protein [Brevibacillus sp. 179-C9.3 HS]|uniref:hypothetical protein n=1 Tax=unclassified Brevibacillus TaxID=2684853 RepID=UPI00399EEE83